MKKIYIFHIILLITITLALTACSGKREANAGFNIPEAEKIQKVLDDMSAAIRENNMEPVEKTFSEGCPRRSRELESLRQLLGGAGLAEYSQTITAAKRTRDGVFCTVSISIRGNSGNEGINGRSQRDVYFIFEDGVWKIGDYNYYPYRNPTVIVGSESVLSDAARRMSEALDSKLRTDTIHLQAYGDIILLGTPYDNASILDLEEKGLTAVRVTEDYPGNSLGIVQVMSNVENYRHVVIIQGSDIKTAENSVDFMAGYLKDNPYLNPGVYFIEEDSLRKARPLELTTLVTLDPDRSSLRLKEVQKRMEANISVVEEELLSEREQLLREQAHLGNQYQEDYAKVFSRYEFSPEQSPYDGMVLINANFTDSRLCNSAFMLPYGNKAGTAYAYNDYMNRNISLASDEAEEDKGLLLKGSTKHIRTAREMGASANVHEITGFGTAILRLSGFSSKEVYSLTTTAGDAVFINIDTGYALSPSSPVLHTAGLQLAAGELTNLYNDGAFINCRDNTANLDAADVSTVYGRTEGALRLSGRRPDKAPARLPFWRSELAEPLNMPYDTEDIYGLLRNTFVLDDSPCLYSTPDEAREQLRSAMGALLAVKCTRYMINTASRYPASQYDYARYAAGLINVEYPGVYGSAAIDSRLLKDFSGGISNLLSDDSQKIEKIVESLRSIAEEESNPDMFFHPDYCIANMSGSVRDKALLAYGLYGRLTGSTEKAWVALGENSSYLVFEEDDQWQYLDCKYNVIKDYVDDVIYAAFNMEHAYNERLGTGEPPDFVR